MFEDLWKQLQGQIQINFIPKVIIPNIFLSMTRVATHDSSACLFQLKAEHNLEINRLKEEVITATNKCEAQEKINSALKASTKTIIERYESIKKLKIESDEKLKRSEAEKADLEKCLDESSELNRLQMERSAESFSKLQEAIKVADEALAEIVVLGREKHQIEAECNNLAQTIGTVMERASDKISRDFEDLKEKHQRDQERFSEEIERLKQAIDVKEAEKISALQQVEALNEKLKLIEDVFGQDVGAAFKTIVSFESSPR